MTKAYQQALATVIEFDEHEAREAGWRDELIQDALAEIQRREGM